MCRVLGVSPNGYYAWRQRQASPRQATDAALPRASARFTATREASTGARGSMAELADERWRIGGKRVARLMQALAVAGFSRRKNTATTVPGPERRPYPDRVERDFTAAAPDEFYVYLNGERVPVPGDRTWRLQPALWQRQQNGVIYHSDQGCHRLRPALPGDRRAPVDGVGRRLLRQGLGRELLRRARM